MKYQDCFDDDSSQSFESHVPFYQKIKHIIDNQNSDSDYDHENENENHQVISDQIDTFLINQEQESQPSKTKTKKIKIILPENSKKIQKNPEEKQKEFYMMPGESKNIPKNYTRAFKQFILSNFETSKRTPSMNRFLALKAEKACKQTFKNLLRDNKLRQVAQQFFGQLKWAPIFLAENKVELEPYFRFNKLYVEKRENEKDQELSIEFSDI